MVVFNSMSPSKEAISKQFSSVTQSNFGASRNQNVVSKKTSLTIGTQPKKGKLPIDYNSIYGSDSKTRFSQNPTNEFSTATGGANAFSPNNSTYRVSVQQTPKGVESSHINYKTFKTMKAGQGLLSNYSQIKKEDIRNNAVKTFINGQDNLFILEKQYSVSPSAKETDLERNNQELIQQLES